MDSRLVVYYKGLRLKCARPLEILLAVLVVLICGCAEGVPPPEEAAAANQTEWSLERLAKEANFYEGGGDAVWESPPERISGIEDLEEWIIGQKGYFHIYEFTSPKGMPVMVLCRGVTYDDRALHFLFSASFYSFNEYNALLTWTFQGRFGTFVPVADRKGIAIWGLGRFYNSHIPWDSLDPWKSDP